MTSPAAVPPAAPRIGALVVAAGAGNRFGGDVPKQFLPMGGVPVVVRAARALLAHPGSAHAVIVLPETGARRWWRRIGPFFAGEEAKVSWCPGGATRQASVRAGLDALDRELPPAADAGAAASDLVAVHDGARPAVPSALVDRVVAAAAAGGAAIPAVTPADTLWRRGRGGLAAEPIDRGRTAAAQTPQCFRRDLLRRAFAAAAAAGFEGTDEASAVRRAGFPVRLVEGSTRNHKVTRPADLAFVGALVGAGPAPPRVGVGFDAHRFGEAGALRLGGVRFPETPALAGHSDGDALLHALTDAILGAVAAPDIGSLFPSSDPSLAGASSVRFLERSVGIARAAGYAPGQADCVVIGERPRLAPRVAELRARLAGLLRIPPPAVGIKATTTDGMGVFGRGEGLAAQAVVRLDPVSPTGGDLR